MQLNTIGATTMQHLKRGILTGCLVIAASSAGCSGGSSSNSIVPVVTPTPQPTVTPRPPQNRFVGSYSGTYTATFPAPSPISGTRTGTLNFSVRADGTVIFTNGAVPAPGQPATVGSGQCNLTTGRITWSSGLTFGLGVRSFSGHLRSTSNGIVTGSGTLDYVERSEFAFGPWQARKATP